MPFEIYDDYIGSEYGDPTEARLDAIILMAQTEGIENVRSFNRQL